MQPQLMGSESAPCDDIIHIPNIRGNKSQRLATTNFGLHLQGFPSPWVTDVLAVMVLGKDLALQILIIGNKSLSLNFKMPSSTAHSTFLINLVDFPFSIQQLPWLLGLPSCPAVTPLISSGKSPLLLLPSQYESGQQPETYPVSAR